jgi:RimJ/RimL family protein N-acetyltransferase
MSKITIRAKALILKQATWADCCSLYWIRNHESIRKNLSNSTKKNFFAHLWWFYTTLLPDLHTIIFLIYQKKRIVGFTLLRKMDTTSKTAELGIMVVNSEKNLTVAPYAIVLTIHFAMHYIGLKHFYSYAAADNLRAKALNLIVGQETQSDHPHEIKFIYTQKIIEKNKKYQMGLQRIFPGTSITGNYQKYRIIT